MNKIVIINGKNYENENNSLQKNMINIVQSFKSDELFFAPNNLTLAKAKNFKNLISQTIYPNKDNSTGFTTLKGLKNLGIHMSIINHSENRVSYEIIKQLIRESKNDFKLIICAENLNEIQKFSELNPYMIAYEPKELIGGTRSVTTEKPEIIKKAVKIFPNILVGAGVKSEEDLIKSLELGAKGVLISSGVMLNPKPEKIISNFLK